jgi:hypothetical protein
MGQGCCVPIDANDVSPTDRSRVATARGWRSLVQSVVDFDRMDKVLNQWRQHDILSLQVSSTMYLSGLTCYLLR